MTPLELLRQRGAEQIEHPGGTLLDHLQRVAARLAGYGADGTLQDAGLVHAAYGTDGFDTALLTLEERPLLREATHQDVEELVYRYAATDRLPFYRQLDQDLVVWTDRFTNRSVTFDPADVAPLVELTVANELDVVAHSEQVRQRYTPALRDLFTRARPRMSPAAWDDVTRTLGRP